MRNKILKKIIYTIFAFTLVILQSSCKKENENNISVQEGIGISFSAVGISDPDEVLKFSSTESSRPLLNVIDDIQAVDNSLDIQTFGDAQGIVKGSSNSSSSPFSKQAATKLANGVKYRVLLYDSNNNFYASEEATVGTPILLEARANRTYQWIAYSYNNTNSIPLPSDTNDPKIPTGSNELLVAKGNITVSATAITPMPITFNHQLGKLRLRLSSENMFAIINSVSSELFDGYLVEGNMRLRTTDLELTDATPIYPNNNVTFTPDPNDNQVFWAEFTTARADISQLKLRFTEMTATYDNGKVIQDINPATPRETNVISTNNIRGKIYTSYVNMVHKFMTKTYTIADDLNESDARAWKESMFNALSNNLGSSNIGSSVPIMRYTATRGPDDINSASDFTAYLQRLTEYPDIIIIARRDNTNSTNIPLLKQFLDKGGYLLLLQSDEGITERILKGLFPDHAANIVVERNGDEHRNYRLPTRSSLPQDSILHGPFSDILALQKRGYSATDQVYQDITSDTWYWGEGSGWASSVTGLPESDIFVYNRFADADGPKNTTQASRNNWVTMFKHKKRHMWCVVDRNFVRGRVEGGSTYTKSYDYPYTFDVSRNYFPIPRLNNGGTDAQVTKRTVLNSTIFWNAFAWAFINSEFYGPNKNPKFL